MNNYSKQRELVLQVIKENLTHPTAEEIYLYVIQKQPKISRSTVYRNINILVKMGKIKKISMLKGPDRYDYLHKEHCHVICKKCGRVFDFYHDFKCDEITNKIKEQIEIDMLVDSITIYGICEDCKSKNI